MATNGPAWAVLSQSRDLGQYEAICRAAAELGARYVACGGLAEATPGQWTDPKDTYCRYFVNSPSVFKFAEAGVVRGVYPAEHVAANMELLRRRSEVLESLGLKGMWNGLEPMWLPEAFFAEHPRLRGPRVDHPARSLHERIAPCTDHAEMREAYAEAVRQMCEAAPALELFEFYTNDAGAGFCWCEWLYPGQNGPESCKDQSMGDRVGGLLKAFVDGGRAAGREVTALLRPKHFTEAETEDYLAKLPAGAGLNYRIFPTQFNTPFMLDYCLRAEHLETLRRRGRRVFVQMPGQGARQGIRQGLPCPFLLLETLAEYSRRAIDGVTLLNPTGLHWINQTLMRRHPTGLRTERERLQAVEAAAAERFGDDLAEAVASFLRDVDMAVRVRPLPSNGLILSLCLVERRALFEPLMQRREDVPVGPDEPWLQGMVHIGPDAERTDLFWDGTITRPVTWLALSYLEPDFDLALGHLARGIEQLEAAGGDGLPGGLREEVERVKVFRCLLATLAHKVQTQQLWGRLEYYGSRELAEGGEALGNSRRALRNVIRREIDNTRELIGLLERTPGVFQWADLEEAVARTGGGVTALLTSKIEMMEADLAKE